MTDDAVLDATRTSPPARPPSSTVRDDGVVLDRTVFYARGGGQPGDTGVLRWEGGQVRVTDTVQVARDGERRRTCSSRVHVSPPLGAAVIAEIDWDRRHMLMRTHTALHALCGIVFTDYGAGSPAATWTPPAPRAWTSSSTA